MCFWLQTILFPLSLSTCLLSYDKKKKNLRFSKWNETHCEAKIYPALSLGREMLFLFLWLTWKENREFSLSLALLASLVQYGWTSNDWLPVICVTIEATWALFMLCVALWMRWGGFLEGGRYVSDTATRWWGYTWFKTRLAGRWRGKLQLQDKVRAVISPFKTGMLHSTHIPTCTHPEIPFTLNWRMWTVLFRLNPIRQSGVSKLRLNYLKKSLIWGFIQGFFDSTSSKFQDRYIPIPISRLMILLEVGAVWGRGL